MVTDVPGGGAPTITVVPPVRVESKAWVTSGVWPTTSKA